MSKNAVKNLLAAHMSCVALDPPGAPNRRWRCSYCKAQGFYDEMMGPKRTIACTHVYPPCKTCGQTPECAPDCAAILGVLNNPPARVRIIGADGPLTPKRKLN